MRILITNDDSINAKAILSLANWARRLGEVTVVAPKFEQSGKSHSIEIFKPFEVKKLWEEEGFEGYSLDSTPADCVRFAFLGMNKNFDLVISGINKGFNVGRDINYSGTAGAMFEGANLGAKAIALSTDPESIDYALSMLDTIWEYVEKNKLLDKNNIYNINVPGGAEKFFITRQGGRYFCDVYVEQGNDMFLPTGRCIYEDSGTNIFDTDAVMHGFVSVTPMKLERTNSELYEDLKVLNENV